MLISHLSPKQLLYTSLYYNDYDYALVHMFEKDKHYLEFFKNSVKIGRRVLLDNSIFELGKAFDSNKFAYWVSELSPYEYIIPDVLDNYKETIKKCKEWIHSWSHLPGKMIAVAQGLTEELLLECIRTYLAEPLISKIAISFNSKPFMNIDKITEAAHRFKFIHNKVRSLIELSYSCFGKPLHLLGVAVPQEVAWYNNFNTELINYIDIESVDTSNPVIHGMFGTLYQPYGLKDKLPNKLADEYYIDISDELRVCIYNNIHRFKQFSEGNII